MKTKGKEAEKKKDEKKRREKGYARDRTQDLRHASQSFTTRLRGTHTKMCRNFIIKTFEPY